MAFGNGPTATRSMLPWQVEPYVWSACSARIISSRSSERRLIYTVHTNVLSLTTRRRLDDDARTNRCPTKTNLPASPYPDDRSDRLDVSGNIRRFRRVCEHIQSQVCSRNVGINLGGQSRAAPPSPRASRKFTTEMNESSSCGSDTSERLFLSPHPATRQVVCFNKVVHHLPPPRRH